MRHGQSKVSKICRATRGKRSVSYLESKISMNRLQAYFTLHLASITSTSEFSGDKEVREVSKVHFM